MPLSARLTVQRRINLAPKLKSELPTPPITLSFSLSFLFFFPSQRLGLRLLAEIKERRGPTNEQLPISFGSNSCLSFLLAKATCHFSGGTRRQTPFPLSFDVIALSASGESREASVQSRDQTLQRAPIRSLVRRRFSILAPLPFIRSFASVDNAIPPPLLPLLFCLRRSYHLLTRAVISAHDRAEPPRPTTMVGRDTRSLQLLQPDNSLSSPAFRLRVNERRRGQLSLRIAGSS